MISLVVATEGVREASFGRLIQSLKKQEVPLQLVVVVQGSHDKFEQVLVDENPKFEVKIVNARRGLSIARNEGLRFVKGEIVAFPDDDCWYPDNLLSRVQDVFREPKIDVSIGRLMTPEGRLQFSHYPTRLKLCTKWDCLWLSVSVCLFFRAELFKSGLSFDEQLGLGSAALFQSGEEADLVLQAFERQSKIWFVPEIQVYHPELKGRPLKRDYVAALVHGKLMRRYRMGFLTITYSFSRAFLYAFLCLFSLRGRDAKKYFNIAIRRLQGYRGERV